MKLHSKHIKYKSLDEEVHGSSMFSQEKGCARKNITQIHSLVKIQKLDTKPQL